MKPPRNYRDAALELTVDPPAVLVNGQTVKFTAKEFALLAYLTANEGEVVSRRELLFTIWGYESPKETRTLDVHIRRVRRKLGDTLAQRIETVFAKGYRFRASRVADFFPLAMTA